MNIKKKIVELINFLPLPIAKLLIKINIPLNFIYGKKYKIQKEEILLNRESYDNKEDLLSLVNNAIKSTPYYREKYNSNSISSIDDFEKNINFIDKNEVQKNFKKFISDEMNKSFYDMVTTSGTSGSSLALYIGKNRYQRELAFLHSIWSQKGFNNHIRAVIRNHKLPTNQNYQINILTKEYIFDAYRTTNEYYSIIYNTIKQNNIKFIHAYPSNAYSFSKFMLNNNLDTSFLIGFICSSENIFDYQRELFKKLNLELISIYGHTEKLIIASNCNSSDHYHFEPMYGYVELVDSNDKVINKAGEFGEIVGTTLDNFGMPLIRYKTGDFATFVGDYCEHCDRKVTLLSNIEGRWSGRRIFGADGNSTTPTSLNLHSELLNYINGIQYFQDKKGEFTVLIIKNKNFTDKQDKELFKHYKSKFSKNTKISIKYVDQLIKQPNGKFLDLISKI